MALYCDKCSARFDQFAKLAKHYDGIDCRYRARKAQVGGKLEVSKQLAGLLRSGWVCVEKIETPRKERGVFGAAQYYIGQENKWAIQANAGNVSARALLWAVRHATGQTTVGQSVLRAVGSAIELCDSALDREDAAARVVANCYLDRHSFARKARRQIVKDRKADARRLAVRPPSYVTDEELLTGRYKP